MTGTKELWRNVRAGVPCWHIHHGVLLEYAGEPLNLRAEYIRAMKHGSQHSLRLRLMRPVLRVAKLPLRLHTAWKKYRAAQKNRNWAKTDVARAKYELVLKKCLPQIEKLHRVECPDCPWNGRTIFARKSRS